jgi:hypothetical protein
LQTNKIPSTIPYSPSLSLVVETNPNDVRKPRKTNPQTKETSAQKADSLDLENSRSKRKRKTQQGTKEREKMGGEAHNMGNMNDGSWNLKAREREGEAKVVLGGRGGAGVGGRREWESKCV